MHLEILHFATSFFHNISVVTAYDYVEEQVQYVPPELLGQCGSDSSKLYHLYSIQLNKNFEYDIPLQDIVLGVNTELELDNGRLLFDLDADRGSIAVSITYIGSSMLTSEQVICRLQNVYFLTCISLICLWGCF